MTIEIKEFEDILRDSLLKCKSNDEKFIKIIDILASQTRLINIILDNLSPDTTEKILRQAGFAELYN